MNNFVYTYSLKQSQTKLKLAHAAYTCTYNVVHRPNYIAKQVNSPVISSGGDFPPVISPADLPRFMLRVVRVL